MSVHVHLIGRFGNNLFQIALGRIIAEKTGYQFSLAQENKDLRATYGLPFDYLDTKFENQEFLPNCQSFIPGKVAVGEPVLINEYNYDSVDQIIDFANGRPIILHGFFQRWKYYLAWREQMREWFFVDLFAPHIPDTLLVRVRHEDYPEDIRLPLSYYETVLASSPEFLIYFAGKGINQDFANRVTQRRNYVQDASTPSVSSFVMGVKSFDAIACANSSFDWWMAFLSQAKRVYIPQPSNPRTYWSAESNQDLCAPIEGWERIEC